ncbi:hypothetical protein CR513_46822, partial [Mucuna pruriens]
MERLQKRCLAFVHISNDDKYKLNPKLKKSIFIGYVKGVIGFKFGDLVSKKMKIMTNVSMIDRANSGSKVVQVDVEKLLVTNGKRSNYLLRGYN